MRALIRVDCGGPHGLGHSTRMLALAKALGARGCDVRFVTETPTLDAFVAPFPCTPRDTEAAYLRPHDILVWDHTTGIPPWPWRMKLRVDGYKLVCIDYPAVQDDDWDLVIAPGAHWDPATIARLQHNFGPRFLHGWDYVMLDEAVTNQAPVLYAERQDGPIAFCAGGSDPTGALEQMYAWTQELALPTSLVFARGQYATEFARGRHERLTPTIHAPFTRDLLRDAAIVVTMLGQIAYECVYWHVPTLCFARTLDDVPRLKVLSDATDGALVACGLFAHATRAWFCRLVQEYWEDASQRDSMAAACAGRIDGRGVARAAEAIVRLA